MLDFNKKELKDWDLFKFRDWWQLIYETFSKGEELKFKGYSFESKQDFDANKLSDFKFEIVWNNKEWVNPKYYDEVKRERLKRGEYFLDS